MMFGEWVNVTLADGNNTSGVIIKSVLEGDSYKLKILFPGFYGTYYNQQHGGFHASTEYQVNCFSSNWNSKICDDIGSSDYVLDEIDKKQMKDIKISNSTIDLSWVVSNLEDYYSWESERFTGKFGIKVSGAVVDILDYLSLTEDYSWCKDIYLDYGLTGTIYSKSQSGVLEICDRDYSLILDADNGIVSINCCEEARLGSVKIEEFNIGRGVLFRFWYIRGSLYIILIKI